MFILMPFVTPKATYHIDGPDKGIIELSEGWKFPYRSMDNDLSCNRILWKGEYDQADGCFTCPRPLYRINLLKIDTPEKWDWLYRLFTFQLNSNLERTIFFDEDPSDVFQTNKFLDEKWEIPTRILKDLAAKGLLQNPNTIRFLNDKASRESSEPQEISEAPKEVVTVAVPTVKKTTAQKVLEKQDSLKEFTK